MFDDKIPQTELSGRRRLPLTNSRLTRAFGMPFSIRAVPNPAVFAFFSDGPPISFHIIVSTPRLFLDSNVQLMRTLPFEGREKDDASADLALISTSQRVENYEIAGYTTAKNLAQQIHNTQIMQLLTESLGEEQNADQLLDQAAASLMSVTKMPVSIA